MVLYEPDRAPFPSALVQASGIKGFRQRVVTNKAGTFEIAITEAGKWKIEAFPFGEDGLSFPVEIEISAGEERNVEILVPGEKTYEVFGRVTGLDGRGLEGVDVNLCSSIGPPLGDETRADGCYGPMVLKVRWPRPVKAGDEIAETEAAVLRLRQRSTLTFDPDRLPISIRQINLNDYPSGKVEVNLNYGIPGALIGYVLAPDGGPAEGVYLRYSFKNANGATSTGTIVQNSRFVIPIWEKGNLVIEPGEAGENYVATERIDLGEVDPSQAIPDVYVRLKWMPRHYVRLVDGQGNLLSDRSIGVSVIVETEPEPRKGCINDPAIAMLAEDEKEIDYGEVDSGIARLPLGMTGLRRLCVLGQGIRTQSVPCTEYQIPQAITVELLPPLLAGFIELPPGIPDGTRPDVIIEARREGGSMSMRSKFRYNAATGQFAIDRFEDSSLKYSVIFTIPGYGAWEKPDFEPPADGPGEPVRVTFEKKQG